jgi:hypothetical protein
MRKWHSQILVSIITLFMVVLMFSPVSTANVIGHGKKVISQQETTIPKGTVVEDAIVLGHDVNVAGAVSEILVVVNGNVHLASTAKSGIIVNIGGIVTQDSGSSTEGIYQFSLGSHFWNGVLFGVVGAIFIWVGMLAVNIVGILLSVLLSSVLRTRTAVPLALLERSVRRTGLIGLLISIATFAACAVLAMVDIGIPLAILIFLVYVLLGIIGFSVISLWLGKLILRDKEAGKPTWLKNLIGASAIMVTANIPVIGLFLFSVFWLIGIGVITVWIPYLWRKKQ